MKAGLRCEQNNRNCIDRKRGKTGEKKVDSEKRKDLKKGGKIR